MAVVYPKAHKVKATKPYVPSYMTDIRKTFDYYREKIKREETDRRRAKFGDFMRFP